MSDKPRYPDNWTWRERLMDKWWMQWRYWGVHDWIHVAFIAFFGSIPILTLVLIVLHFTGCLPQSGAAEPKFNPINTNQFVLDVENFSQKPARVEGIHIHGNYIKGDMTFLPKVSYQYVFSNGVLSHIVRSTEEKIMLDRFTQWGTNALEVTR